MTGPIWLALVALALYVSCCIPDITDRCKIRNGKYAQIALTLSLMLACVHALRWIFSIEI